MGALITKEEFLKVYNSYPPNNWIKFTFRYFSQMTIKKDKWLKSSMFIILFILFLGGFIGTVLNLSHVHIACMIYPFAAILASFGILMFGTLIMNNLRIRKIRKKLNITRHEYENFSKMYL